jgi:signal transduction histidine kinase
LYKIKEGIQEAMNTTRDIVWMLDDESDTVEHLNYRISQFALSLCQANGVQFQREVDAEVMHHRLHQKEKRNLYLIMKEAINNSIKYADANEIRIKIYLEDKKLCVIIQDDGKGFCLPCVEEGNGLSNIRLRAKEMNYHFTIYADLHKGTCIELREV